MEKIKNDKYLGYNVFQYDTLFVIDNEIVGNLEKYYTEELNEENIITQKEKACIDVHKEQMQAQLELDKNIEKEKRWLEQYQRITLKEKDWILGEEYKRYRKQKITSITAIFCLFLGVVLFICGENIQVFNLNIPILVLIATMFVFFFSIFDRILCMDLFQFIKLNWKLLENTYVYGEEKTIDNMKELLEKGEYREYYVKKEEVLRKYIKASKWKKIRGSFFDLLLRTFILYIIINKIISSDIFNISHFVAK